MPLQGSDTESEQGDGDVQDEEGFVGQLHDEGETCGQQGERGDEGASPASCQAAASLLEQQTVLLWPGGQCAADKADAAQHQRWDARVCKGGVCRWSG